MPTRHDRSNIAYRDGPTGTSGLMSRRRKIALGVATVWPILWMVPFAAWMALTFASGTEAPGFTVVIILHVATVLMAFALLVYYVVHAAKTDRLGGDERTVWIVVLVIGTMFAAPVYWYLYVWREGDARSSSQASASMNAI
jgi:hypothetical protein